MGFFDRFTSKKPAPAAPASPTVEGPADAPASPSATQAAVKPRLLAARELLEVKDLAGALAVYEEVLSQAGDRADVLVTISGDLGAHGHVAQIVELVAPRYDAERHGPATGLNLLQAYLAMRNPDAAQHVLDILFSLNRPELEERLFGFSNAIAEQLSSRDGAADPSEPAPAAIPKVGLVTISKPIWSYGLENIAGLLPAKQGKLRRIAFGQLALPGADVNTAIHQPEDELGRLSRAIPLWLAETFYLSPHYAPVAAIGTITPPDGGKARLMVFGAEWTTENLRQLVDTTSGGLDYIVAGALRTAAGDYELVLRVYEVKSYRERKKFSARWTPATADTELANLHGEVRRFMEWSQAPDAMTYAAPASPRAWLETLGASAGLFLAGKGVIAPEALAPIPPDLAQAAQRAASSECASLAYLTLAERAKGLGVDVPTGVALASTPLVQQATA